MTEVLFFQSRTGKKYKIISFDRDKGTVRLEGPTRQFDVTYSKEHFKTMGYKLVKVEEADVS